jgi:uncharacterized protein
MRRSTAYLPLHGGKAPAWLFQRMKQMAGAITMAVVDAHGPEEMLRRLADPWWFQAFGCALGFDWHSSGLTTVTCGALKEAGKIYGNHLGIVVAGGKGGTSRKTPDEIARAADRYSISGGDRLVYASRMSAKVDSAAVQDGYQIYHHSFFLTAAGAWCVVQQGMNEKAGMARRYHWLGESVEDFVCEPHQGIQTLGEGKTNPAGLLNMVAFEAGASREASVKLVQEKPDLLLRELKKVPSEPSLFAPVHHAVLPGEINLDRLRKIVTTLQDQPPRDFEVLLGMTGVGPATVRSLSLLAELIYQAPVSRRDPARPPEDPLIAPPAMRRKWADYSYAHGGKDGHPFPVDRKTYDQNIRVLLDAVRSARLGNTEKTEALKRLTRICGDP